VHQAWNGAVWQLLKEEVRRNRGGSAEYKKKKKEGKLWMRKRGAEAHRKSGEGAGAPETWETTNRPRGDPALANRADLSEIPTPKTNSRDKTEIKTEKQIEGTVATRTKWTGDGKKKAILLDTR